MREGRAGLRALQLYHIFVQSSRVRPRIVCCSSLHEMDSTMTKTKGFLFRGRYNVLPRARALC
jgi:hypothetical protein